jgi:hypothetical protein
MIVQRKVQSGQPGSAKTQAELMVKGWVNTGETGKVRTRCRCRHWHQPENGPKCSAKDGSVQPPDIGQLTGVPPISPLSRALM